MTQHLTIDSDINEIVENFSFLESWEDRYGYLIELGNALVSMPDAELNDGNKVQGCVSQVWLSYTYENGQLFYKGMSDAHIVRGLVAIALSIFSGKSPAEIIQTDERPIFEAIGLQEHLTPQRSNGLKSMVARVKQIATENLQN